MHHKNEEDKVQNSLPENLLNYYCVVNNRVDKLMFTLDYLRRNPGYKTILFFNTCASVRFYYKMIEALLIADQLPLTNNVLFMMHGQMKQKQRDKIYSKFKTQQAGVLVCTDVCARGVDFHDVTAIIQIDPP